MVCPIRNGRSEKQRLLASPTIWNDDVFGFDLFFILWSILFMWAQAWHVHKEYVYIHHACICIHFIDATNQKIRKIRSSIRAKKRRRQITCHPSAGHIQSLLLKQYNTSWFLFVTICPVELRSETRNNLNLKIIITPRSKQYI